MEELRQYMHLERLTGVRLSLRLLSSMHRSKVQGVCGTCIVGTAGSGGFLMDMEWSPCKLLSSSRAVIAAKRADVGRQRMQGQAAIPGCRVPIAAHRPLKR